MRQFRYALGMPKARSRKLISEGQRSMTTGLTAEYALPPRKPPAPSVKNRLKRDRRAKLLK
jgi:hypothetical protein